MANNCLGNISICKTCIYQRFNYLTGGNYCERLDAASVTFKQGCSPECDLYYPTPWASIHQVKKYFIKKVIFKDPLTIVLWMNGDKTIVKCQEGDIYDPEKGLAMAICKYAYGNKSRYNEVFKKWLPEDVSDGSEGNTQ